MSILKFRDENGEIVEILALKGDQGPQGPQGQQGADGIGISSSMIDDDGELVVTYTNGNTVNLGVVVGPNGERGEKGDDGATGPQGPKGLDGKSAYELAVQNGFEGTEQEWLESLIGAGSGTLLKKEDAYKLLDTITLTEEKSEIIFDKYTDGTELNLQKAYVILRLPKVGKTFWVNMHVNNKYYMYIGNTFGNTGYNTIYDFDANIENGLLSVEYSYHTNSSNNSGTKNIVVRKLAKKISALIFEAASGNTFPVGTVFEIYGTTGKTVYELTEADKAEIKGYVQDAILGGEW